MTDRNWEAEMAKIDRQLASISDEQLVAEKRAAIARPAQAAAASAAPTSIAVQAKPRGQWRGWLQATIATAAAAGLWFWPWPSSCGMPLYGFVAATGAVTLLGAWSAIGAWRHRLAAAHVLSLVVMGWGIALGAREVLPRVGYAIPTELRGATWSCEVTPPAAPAVTAPAVAPPASDPSQVPPTNAAPSNPTTTPASEPPPSA